MDGNEYLLECMVRDRLRAERARARAAIGHALIRLRRALASEPARRTRHA